jgi:hypothetical protein
MSKHKHYLSLEHFLLSAHLAQQTHLLLHIMFTSHLSLLSSPWFSPQDSSRSFPHQCPLRYFSINSSHNTTNSIHSYYTSLSPKTRLMVGGGIIGYACLGLFLADTAEEKLGYTPTEEDKKRLREALPKIRVVEE